MGSKLLIETTASRERFAKRAFAAENTLGLIRAALTDHATLTSADGDMTFTERALVTRLHQILNEPAPSWSPSASCTHPNCATHGKSPCEGVDCNGLDAEDRARLATAVSSGTTEPTETTARTSANGLMHAYVLAEPVTGGGVEVIAVHTSLAAAQVVVDEQEWVEQVGLGTRMPATWVGYPDGHTITRQPLEG